MFQKIKLKHGKCQFKILANNGLLFIILYKVKSIL